MAGIRWGVPIFCFVLVVLCEGFSFNLFEALQEGRFLLVGIILNGRIVVQMVVLGTNLCCWLMKLSVTHPCQGWSVTAEAALSLLMRRNQSELCPPSVMLYTPPAKHRGKYSWKHEAYCADF